jgi:ferredoxin
VDCIVPGKPVEKWPWYYIDPDTCIDCGACIPECPFEAIFEEEGVPSDFAAKGGEVQSMPEGTDGFDQAYEGENQHGDPVKLKATRALEEGQVVDLTADISPNYDYFKDGPGYQALED